MRQLLEAWPGKQPGSLCIRSSVWGVALIVATISVRGLADQAENAGDAEVGRLVEQLDHDDFHVRERATRKLMGLGMRAVGPVGRAASTQGLEVTIRAIDILHQIGIGEDVRAGDAAHDALQKIVDGKSSAASARAAAVVGSLREGREQRAMALIRRYGGKIAAPEVYAVDDPFGAAQRVVRIQGRIMILPGGNFRGGPLDSVVREEATVTIGSKWTGGAERLQLLRRVYSATRVVLQGEQVTDEWIKQLSGASNLGAIQLASTRVTNASVPVIQSMENLKSIELIDTSITRIQLTGLRKLETLRVRGKQPADVRLSSLPALETVDLRDQAIKSLELQRVPAVTQLGLQLARGDGVDLRVLSAVKDARVLDLAGERIDDAQLDHLTGMRQLSMLSLKRTAVTDRGILALAASKNLESLDIWYSPVTDSGVLALKDLQKLQQVKLYGTKVTEQGAAARRRVLPQARVDRRGGALLGVSGSADGGPCTLSTVRPDSAADKAGLKPGDSVKKIDDATIRDFDDLTRAVADKKGGDKVQIELERNGRTIKLEVTLGEWE